MKLPKHLEKQVAIKLLQGWQLSQLGQTYFLVYNKDIIMFDTHDLLLPLPLPKKFGQTILPPALPKQQ